MVINNLQFSLWSSFWRVWLLQLLLQQQGYAILDLEVLNPSKVPGICLSKFVALILQVLPILAGSSFAH